MAIMLNPNAIPKGSITQEMIDVSAFEGIYELLTAGYALNLVGKGNGEPQAFMSRKTGGGNITDGSAVIKEVDGVQPIVWNQLVDRQTAPTALVDSTITESGDEIIITTSAAYGGARIPLGATIIVGHKYLIAGEVKSLIRASMSTSEAGINVAITNTNYTLLSAIGVAKTGDNRNEFFFWNLQSQENTISVKKSSLMFIDLTQMFGAGNEPSTYEEYLDRISHYHIKDAYAYNAGEVVNYRGTGIKTTGRNIWDEEWEVGSLDGGTGQPVGGASIFRSKNYCPILGGTEYYLTSASFLINLFYYDKDKNFIAGKIFYGKNVAFTTPGNAAYFKVRTDSPNNTYNHDICINLSDPAFNGQYEPYRSYVRDWSEVMKKYFPDGMTSLNGVKDFFDDKKAVRKWGCKVFDGTENSWRIESGAFVLENLPFSNGCISQYPFKKGYNSTFENEDKVVYYELYYHYNYFKDTAYTTVDAWKAHLADLYAQGNPLVVYYELAEPVEDIFEKPLNLTYTVINGGTETSLATENSTQFEGSIFYGKDYVGVIDELQLQNRVTQIEFENWEN